MWGIIWLGITCWWFNGTWKLEIIEGIGKACWKVPELGWFIVKEFDLRGGGDGAGWWIMLSS